jgi:hypothetical protein
LVACLTLGLIAPLSAQNLASTQRPSKISFRSGAAHGDAPRFSGSSTVPGSYEVPDMDKVHGEVSDEPPVFRAQDAPSLNEKTGGSRNAETAENLDVLRKPSPYRKMAAGKRPQRYEVASDSLQSGLALISALYREAGKSEKAADCSTIALSVAQRIKHDPSRLLELVELEVAANANCACEIVKTAISTSEADTPQVVAIVEAAIHAAPDSMRIISQCALAASPESITGVQDLLARLDPNAGESGSSSKSAKSAKSAKVASIISPPPNPLDRPPPEPPLPPYFPPPVTDVDP